MVTTDLNATYDDFEPYVGGIPSPNPSYPQEIQSVVNPKLSVCGKNLFDINNPVYCAYDEYNFNKEYLGCCVMHEETKNDSVPSYFGHSVYLMFPSDTELDISCYDSGQKVVVYGEVVQTWSGIFIIPKYIEEE